VTTAHVFWIVVGLVVLAFECAGAFFNAPWGTITGSTRDLVNGGKRPYVRKALLAVAIGDLIAHFIAGTPLTIFIAGW
jgi:hypothetical protein